MPGAVLGPGEILDGRIHRGQGEGRGVGGSVGNWGKTAVMAVFSRSVAKSRPAPCDPMDGNTPGSSVLH